MKVVGLRQVHTVRLQCASGASASRGVSANVTCSSTAAAVWLRNEMAALVGMMGSAFAIVIYYAAAAAWLAADEGAC
jgi:hypothetical protein